MGIIKKIKEMFTGKAGVKTPRRFWTSDLHFNHDAVRGYCDRPYKTVEAMNEAIISQWNSQVSPQDTVYILGDFSLSPRHVEEIGPRLNGTKHLITGNHDKCFNHLNNNRPSNKVVKFIDRYLKVFSSVQSKLVLELKDGRNVLMSHFPYRNEAGGKYDVRYWEHRPEDKGMVLLHGHLHSKYIKMGRMIDVGYDGSLKLYSEDDILNLINDERDFIPSRITDYYKQRKDNRNEQTDY